MTDWNDELTELRQLRAEVAALRSQAKSNREFAAEQLDWLENAEMGSANAMRLRYLARIRAAALRAQEPAPPKAGE